MGSHNETVRYYIALITETLRFICHSICLSNHFIILYGNLGKFYSTTNFKLLDDSELEKDYT